MNALDGIVVLDLTRGYPAAQSAMFLADFGARVIRIDPPQGNLMELQGGIDPKDERYAALNRLNRSKETIVIDFRKKEGLDVFFRLVKKADVLVEGFRPGVMKRFGADYDTIKEMNPRLVYCSVSGYGSYGPYAQLPGHDPCFLGITGALSMIGPWDAAPCYPSNYVGDMGGAAMHATVGILIALLARDKIGYGQYVDISFMDGTFSLMEYDVLSYLYSGLIPRRGETHMTGNTISSHIFKCADGEYFLIACGEFHFWKNLCQALGKDELIPYHTGMRPGPMPEDQAKGIKELEKVFLTKTRDEWWDLLKDKNTCVAPVNNIKEAMDDPQLRDRQMVLEIEHPMLGKMKQIGFPVKLSETPAKINNLGHIMGTDTLKIMEELDYSREDIKKLMQEEIIK
jgi:crotonobetainyl-CoA:carnitine CoA-transferase CaiB-like acyl-CoA transferase